MTISKKHILILPSWYPNQFTKWNGVFNRAYAIEIAKKNLISVLHVDHREEVSETTINESWDDGFYTIKLCIPIEKGVLGKWENYKNFKNACYIGYDKIRKNVAPVDLCHNLVPWKMGLFARELQSRFGIPYITTIHATAYLPGASGYSKFQFFNIRKILKEAKIVTTVSQSLLHAVNNLFSIESKSIVVPNIVEWVEMEHDLPRLKNTFVHVSSLNKEQKNPIGIIRAIAAVPDSCLHIYGGYAGIGKQAVLKEITTLGLESRVVVYEEQDKMEMLQKLSQYEGMINFSNFETFSLVTAEAVCMGLPVIYTSCGGPEEYMTDFAGIKVNKNNQEELVIAIKQLIEDTLHFNRNEIKEYYRNYFNNKKVGDTFSDLYKQLEICVE